MGRQVSGSKKLIKVKSMFMLWLFYTYFTENYHNIVIFFVYEVRLTWYQISLRVSLVVLLYSCQEGSTNQLFIVCVYTSVINICTVLNINHCSLTGNVIKGYRALRTLISNLLTCCIYYISIFGLYEFYTFINLCCIENMFPCDSFVSGR